MIHVCSDRSEIRPGPDSRLLFSEERKNDLLEFYQQGMLDLMDAMLSMDSSVAFVSVPEVQKA